MGAGCPPAPVDGRRHLHRKYLMGAVDKVSFEEHWTQMKVKLGPWLGKPLPWSPSEEKRPHLGHREDMPVWRGQLHADTLTG
jgi:hypothetical protein